MNIEEMTMEQIEARKAEIATEIEKADEARLAELNAEIDGLEVRRQALIEIAEKEKAEKELEERKANAQAVVAGAGVVLSEAKEERKMENVIESRAYMDAYANYIKTGRADECRSLLTENASGDLPVPAIVSDIVATAWERDDIMSRVNRTFIKGNLKVAFEKSADGAYVHTEGTTAPTEEDLQLGIVTMVPANIKKWITISDEAVAMGGEAFLRYIYDELTYQIVKKLAAVGIADITGASASHSDVAIGVPVVKAAPSVTAIPTAAANLSDGASDICVIMNRLTEVEFIKAHAAGQFAVDPFAGLTKVYTSALPAYSSASENDTYAIVGDLKGLQYNFPEGDNVVIKWDDLSQAEKDMVKVVGREYAAHKITKPGRFCKLTKPAAVTA